MAALAMLGLLATGCAVIRLPYDLATGAVRGGVWVVKTTYQVTAGTVKVVYRVGQFTYEVVKAPIDSALARDGVESIDGVPVRDAIQQGRVKSAPYVVRGTRYVPMSLEEAQAYREEGVASWYGRESGRMTATGEVFDADGLFAAHKHLPIPTFVKVTNLENDRWVIVRVNDRGPFVKGRLIDLSQGAARQLGYYAQGTARVRVEAIQLREE